MTIRVNGPNNVETVPLGTLDPYQTFADPTKVDEVYFFLRQHYSEVECLRLSPRLGKTFLSMKLPVHRIHLDIDWKYE